MPLLLGREGGEEGRSGDAWMFKVSLSASDGPRCVAGHLKLAERQKGRKARGRGSRQAGHFKGPSGLNCGGPLHSEPKGRPVLDDSCMVTKFNWRW